MTTPEALGTFAVVAEAAAVAAFRRATGCGGDDRTVPATFPMRWLARPDVRCAIMALLPEPDLVPVHESQSFDYAGPLEPQVAYHLALSAARSCEPERLSVHGLLLDDMQRELLRLETVLRLVAVPAAA